MKAISLVRKVRSLGGTAEIITKQVKNYRGEKLERIHVEGLLNGYDVHMLSDDCTFFTLRKVSDREYYDAGSDYNSGGYTFCHRLNQIERYAEKVAA